jgi:hypothetical protein
VNRWLLNTFSNLELGLIIVGGFVVIAAAGLQVVRWRFPHFREEATNNTASAFVNLIAVVYGIVLAFAIVKLFTGFQGASDHVRNEASTVSKVYRDSQQLAPPFAARMKTAIGRYIDDVTTVEWPKMRKGQDSAAAWQDLAAIYDLLGTYHPVTQSQQAFYQEDVSMVNELTDARRARLNDVRQSLPVAFQVLLIAGALMLVGYTFLFHFERKRLEDVMVLSTAAVVGFNLLLALLLEYPFSGSVSITPSPFHEGALVVFKPG